MSAVALVAPAGYGKSMLLAEWAAHDPRQFVWLQLDLPPEHPDELLGAIARGLAGVLAASGQDGQEPPGRLPRGRRERATPSEVLALAEQIERAGLETVIVLDQFETLPSEPSREALAALFRGLPRCATLALASRAEVRAGLGRLRAEDALLELGPRDLEMTAYEAGRLMGNLGVELNQEVLEVLVERTEGWPAGIHLAGVTLRERDAPPARARLSGHERVIADYVREEVLAALEPDRLRMLRRVSILDQLSGELCDAVLQTRGSGQALRRLAGEGTMLVALNPAGSWFRIHGLVRDVLRAELAQCEREDIAPLHTRASEWFARHGLRQRALDHAAAAHDASRTGRLLLEDPAGLLAPNRREHERWLKVFPTHELAASPELALAGALTELSRGRAAAAWQLAQPALERTAGCQPSPLLGGLRAVEAAAGRGGIESLLASAAQACELLAAGSVRALALLLRGVASQLRGDSDGGRCDLEDAASEAAAKTPLLESLALSQLALIDLADSGQRAYESSVRALEALRGAHLAREPTAALALAVSALVKSRRGISDEAKGELASAARMLQSLGSYMPWYEVEVRVVLARASVRLADVDRARSLLAEASRWARRSRPVPGLVRWIDEAWGEIDAVGAAALTGARSLTMAELRVLRFLPTHLSFREIGERLHVSGNTVKSQAHAVYAKLDASSRSEAVARASALGLIDVTVT